MKTVFQYFILIASFGSVVSYLSVSLISLDFNPIIWEFEHWLFSFVVFLGSTALSFFQCFLFAIDSLEKLKNE